MSDFKVVSELHFYPLKNDLPLNYITLLYLRTVNSLIKFLFKASKLEGNSLLML